MRLEILRWDAPDDPTEESVRRRLEQDGFSAFCWSDAPHAHYDTHAHDRDESIWLVAGEMRFGADGRDLILKAGDRLMLPAGTLHTADAGAGGATYVIGQKR